MEKPCLNDKEDYPSDEVLGRCLGPVKAAWDAFMDLLDEKDPPLTREWRYYNDGKSWLYKVTKKKKTVCWVSVYDRLFKTTFYFPDRAEPLIIHSGLDKKHIEKFVHGKRYGKTRGLTITVTQPSDLSATQCLIGIKEQLK